VTLMGMPDTGREMSVKESWKFPSFSSPAIEMVFWVLLLLPPLSVAERRRL
jgi:hypothetical protein